MVAVVGLGTSVSQADRVVPALIDDLNEALEAFVSEGKYFYRRDDQPRDILNNLSLFLALQLLASIPEHTIVKNRLLRNVLFTIKEPLAQEFTRVADVSFGLLHECAFRVKHKFCGFLYRALFSSFGFDRWAL